MRKFSRWTSLVGGIYLAICCAVNYAFSVFSPLLTDQFHFTLTEVNLIATIGNVGMYFTLPAGYIYDKYEATVSIFIGMILGTVGYSLMFFATLGWFGQSINPIIFGLTFALGAQSQGYFDTSGLCTNMKNFPGSDLKVIGIQKAFNGLGAAVFAGIYEGFCLENKTLYLGLIPVIVLLFSANALVTIHAVGEVERGQRGKEVTRGFYYMYAISITIAFYTLATSLIESQLVFGKITRLSIAFGLVALLLLFQLVPQIVGENRQRANRDEVALTNWVNQDALTFHRPEINIGQNTNVSSNLCPVEPSFKLSMTIRTPEMWFFFLICFSVTGAGLTVINNISQMDRALRHKNLAATQSALVSIIAFGSATGRMGFGYLQAVLSGRLSKVFWPQIVTFIMTGTMIYFAYSSPNMLFYGALFCGWAYGGLWVILPTLSKAMFGTKYLGQNYNFLNLAPMCGSFICSTYIAGRNYDYEASKQYNEDSNTCYGSVCYRRTFIILAIINGVTFCVSVLIFPNFFELAVKKRTNYAVLE